MTSQILSAIAAALMITSVSAESYAKDRVVHCQITSGGKVEVDGKCFFGADPSGSFVLDPVDKDKPLFGEILDVGVVLVGKDVAEVRGLTKGGISSRWGEAHRSTTDRACWDGVDFRICAY
jgi:hypothetical protein